MTPVCIETLLHAHYRREPFPDSIVVIQAADYLARHEMIEIVPDDRPVNVTTVPSLPIYRTTDKGKCFVDHICKLPLPVETWSIPEKGTP